MPEVIIVTAQTGGAESITRQGHLRLPAPIRHLRHLNPGDRLLVATALTPGLLAIYTLAQLEAILLEHHVAGAPR